MSPRRKCGLRTGLRKVNHKKRIRMTRSRPRAGGTRSIDLSIAPTAEPEFALVASVSVVVTVLAPGITFVGEKDAVHLLGSPVQEKDTEELNEPYWGVT